MSFANPNYHYEDRKNSNDKLNKDIYSNESNIYDEIDASTISLLDKKGDQDSEKMLLENKDHNINSEKKRLLLNDTNSSDEEVEMSTDEEVENKDKGVNEKVESENIKNLKNSEKCDEKSNGSVGKNRKKQGFMGYYTMLEAKAKEKHQKIIDTPDTEEETETPTQGSRFTKLVFVRLKAKIFLVLYSETREVLPNTYFLVHLDEAVICLDMEIR